MANQVVEHEGLLSELLDTGELSGKPGRKLSDSVLMLYNESEVWHTKEACTLD